jgi:hypothetical protein
MIPPLSLWDISSSYNPDYDASQGLLGPAVMLDSEVTDECLARIKIAAYFGVVGNLTRRKQLEANSSISPPAAPP